MNYFELFDLPCSFNLDVTNLADRYRELQRAVHPDKFAHGTEQEKRLAVSQAAQINDAFQTLKQPILRAEYMLMLKDINIKDETTTLKDTSFLMQQMQWRESLEEIGLGGDAQDKIDTLRISFSEYQQQLICQLETLLLSDSANDAALAADQVRKLKFMAKLQDELELIQDKLFE